MVFDQVFSMKMRWKYPHESSILQHYMRETCFTFEIGFQPLLVLFSFSNNSRLKDFDSFLRFPVGAFLEKSDLLLEWLVFVLFFVVTQQSSTRMYHFLVDYTF